MFHYSSNRFCLSVWSGNEYQGEWKENMQDGVGTMRYSDGEIESGLWRASLFQGPLSEHS